jgi:hypothetical protein
VSDAKEQRSLADQGARIMLLKRGEYAYAYNGAGAVEAADGLIVAAELTHVAPDEGHLPGLVAAVRVLRSSAGRSRDDPTTVSADAGYFSRANGAEDGAGLDLLIAAGRRDPAAPTTAAAQPFTLEQFGYDQERDAWQCPAAAWLERQRASPGGTGRPPKKRSLAAARTCGPCPLRQRCLKPGETQRVGVAWRGSATGARRSKLRQPAARRR